ncbi:MAG TPA: T9SS type A sorting domain-containing protein [Chitinophagaceae bacterium]|nr:T9SS type A sorting domain-containing protein [Chitinophagaceae bacterium]
MTISTLWNRNVPRVFIWIPVLLLAASASGQVIRNYGIIYSNTIKGGHTMFGNTILARDATAMNYFNIQSNGQTSTYGNDNADMEFVDVDGTNPVPPATLVNFGDSWNYYVRTTNTSNSNYFNYTTSNGPGTYYATSYTQASGTWASGSTPVRFNMGTGGTTLGTSNTSNARTRNTYYFLKTVNLSASPSLYTGLTLNVRYDDGIIVYVNGTEVGRAGMPAGGVDYNTSASSCNGSSYATASFTVSPSLLVSGNNVIAAEVHQSTACSGTADLYFDLSFTGTTQTVSNTFNSSSSDLVLPAGTNTIKYARLYWGGRINTGDANYATRKTVMIRKGTSGNYQTVTAPAAQYDETLLLDNSGTNNDEYAYQAYVDVTSYINNNGAGTYTVADIAVTTGTRGSGGYYGGWGLVVVYENSNEPYRTVRLYDGFLLVQNGATQTINLTGLNAPNNTLSASDAYMTCFAWEGDANLAATTSNPAGDYIKVNGNVVSNAVNPSTNMWNGTISRNGSQVTTKNPNYVNQMGIDIDEIQVGNYNIGANATTVSVEFGTEADQYFPSVFAFSMVAKDPTISLDKTVKDQIAPFGTVQANDILTYTLSGGNTGQGAANNCVIVDTIPAGLTYVGGSLEVVTAPGVAAGFLTDAQDGDIGYVGTDGSKTYVKVFIGNGASGTSGGSLANGDSYILRFKVKAPANANSLVSYINTARITGLTQGGDPVVDDGTAVIGPMATTLDVKLGSFTVQTVAGNAQLDWVTLSETRNDHFVIERSTDGIRFDGVGDVKGAGTTSYTTHYRFSDPLAGVAASVLYYRLRIVDIDGKSTFSKIVALRLGGSVAIRNYTVYPNPFTGNIKLSISSTKETGATIRISNAAGQVLVNRTVTLQPGDNVVVLGNLDALQTGLHVMEILTEDGHISQKIMKR